MTANKEPIFVYISGKGNTLKAIVELCKNVTVRCVFSNNPNALGLQFAKDSSIHTCVTDTEIPSDTDFPPETDNLIYMIGKIGKPKMVVLAGYMKILPISFISYCNAFKIDIINIHPSLLPKYKGLHTHKRVLESDDTIHGFTIHYVTNELDSGNIIYQYKFCIEKNDTIETLTKAIKMRELLVYPKVIDELLEQ